MCKLLGATAIGVAIAFIVSFTVFPSRALGQVQRLMATSLERMANLSFHVLGQLCEVTPPPLLCKHLGWPAGLHGTSAVHACCQNVSNMESSPSP